MATILKESASSINQILDPQKSNNGTISSNNPLLHQKLLSVKWANAHIDTANKVIRVSIFINFTSIHLTYDEFNDLQNLAMQGIHHYWSRKVTIDNTEFKVDVHVLPRKNNSLPVDLAMNHKHSYVPSRNPMILGLHARFTYNKMQYSSVFLDRRDFKLGCAHAFGHAILHTVGGIQLSWTHKGSSQLLFEKANNTAPGYPISGDIDLMSYYDQSKQPIGFIRKFRDTIASEADVLRLISICHLKTHYTSSSVIN